MPEIAPLIRLLEAQRQHVGDVGGCHAIPQRVRILNVHQGLVYLLPGELPLLILGEVSLHASQQWPSFDLILSHLLLL